MLAIRAVRKVGVKKAGRADFVMDRETEETKSTVVSNPI
jgi:D-alanine-D-alanine ligase-like ATP-grasp enzyme